ncbi:hypothetical protein TNIN_322791 [Trichonephila inaurata madagascariensis]|uniref:Uncharacterized protein n=1 Tax=Trichonephila inaurata madagascariensis TaxID=2747483 RepID=A0A8X6K3L4_9ARAC|nr:hypothetical protein TNIN_322791 [Trichonephila inaurata madagascariensis]
MANDHDSNMECTNVPLPTSRTSSPDLFTPCEQLIQVQNEIKKFTLLTLGAQQSLNSLAPFMTTDDPEVSELFQRLKFYEEELRRSECEYGTLSPCTTPGCAVHGTPPSTPSKSLKDYPALPKTNSNKRKESDDGFISPTRRQTIKKPNLITNSNFSLETGNVYESLKEKDITGTSNTQDTTLDTNISPNTTQIKKFLPPPVMLFCTDTIRDIMKIINNSFPNLRSKLSDNEPSNPKASQDSINSTEIVTTPKNDKIKTKSKNKKRKVKKDSSDDFVFPKKTARPVSPLVRVAPGVKMMSRFRNGSEFITRIFKEFPVLTPKARSH